MPSDGSPQPDLRATQQPRRGLGALFAAARQWRPSAVARDPLALALWSAVALNVPLAIIGEVWHSFDFGNHVFFADHYQRSWWSLWEPRWFAGFNVASYPPLTHQLAALLGWIIGIENAVTVLTLVSVILFPLAIFSLAQELFGRRAAQRAAILAVVMPSYLLAAYAFGQLPTIFALDVSLVLAATFAAFLRVGGRSRLALILALAGVVVAAHHATFIFFLPPLLGTVTLAALARSSARASVLGRAALAVVLLALVAVLTVLPFWIWHATEYVSQVAIDHQSRHNFWHDLVAQDLFFWLEHGVLLVTLPLAARLTWRRPRRYGPWLFLALFLVVLGTGGTTPLPALLFGSQWSWLTYDRFSLWSDVVLVILLGTVAARAIGPAHANRFAVKAAWVLTLGGLGAYALTDALMPALLQSEPAAIDPAPIVRFLASNGHSRWRYLTLGFGDQSARLSALTVAPTLDGSYFTARRLPVLTESGTAQLDFVLYWDPQARALRAILADPGSYSLRWVFTKSTPYRQILRTAGWHDAETLSNGVEVWQPEQSIQPIPDRWIDPACVGRPTTEPPASHCRDLPGSLANGEMAPIWAIWWGVVPLATLGVAAVLGLNSIGSGHHASQVERGLIPRLLGAPSADVRG